MFQFSEPAASKSASFDLLTIDARTDQELDTLPFGVIALDDEGTILRYNLYESQFARLDRNQVLGRDFFNDVARCTRGDVFEGRFRRGVASGATGSFARFAFLFDFKFGAQDVEVEMVRPAGVPRYYLLINRRKVSPPRPDRGPDQVAVSQRELAPDEGTKGVRRDPIERRVVEVPWAFFAALRATCDQLAPETWPLFCAEWGVQLGRRLAIDLETTAIATSGRGLAEVPMTELATMLSRRLAEQGWGKATFDFEAIREGVLVIEVARSVLAEAAPRVRRTTGEPRADLACPLLAGTLGAMISHVAGRRLAAREVTCSSAGDDACRFVVTAHARRAAIDAAIASGERGVPAIREALRRAPTEARGE
ncbi:MAG: 4-vinyl reductase [Deltaproteobacteria bacterium]|nr:4-vinyl reductase [Deltaproteobacteria bacterium]